MISMKRTRSTLRSRHSSKAFLSASLLALAAGGVAAQQQDTLFEIQSPILTIDQERLLAETQAGTAAFEQLEVAAQELSAENQRIEAELTQRERELTDQRPELSPEEFRDLADAFDARVQQIRAEQDEKARALNRARDEARAAFFQEAAETISDIVREKGAVIVLDRRDVFLSADRIDITDEAIERLNADDPEKSE